MSPDAVSVLAPYWQGTDPRLPWGKLEEYGYQLFIEGQVFLPVARQDLIDVLAWFGRPDWLYSEDGETVPIAREVFRDDEKVKFVATSEGRDLLDCIYPDWKRIFMD